MSEGETAVVQHVDRNAVTNQWAEPAEAGAEVEHSFAGTGFPIGNLQPTLAITQAIAIQGVFPSRQAMVETSPETATGPATTYLAEIRHFAFNFAPVGFATTSGQILPLSQNTALFSLLGTFYGGDGKTTFALPDLGERLSVNSGQGPGLSDRFLGEVYGSIVTELDASQMPAHLGGGGQPFDHSQPTLVTNYFINPNGVSPDIAANDAYIVGAIFEAGSNFTPYAMLACDGAMLSIADYGALFAVIGTTYGGDGQSTFAVPDLRGRTIIGAGPTTAVGTLVGAETSLLLAANLPANMGGGAVAIDNRGPALVLNYIIATQGQFPSQSAQSVDADPEAGAGPGSAYLGEIIAFAGNTVPQGYMLAAGQFLPINQNQALFSLLGTSYGGNGQTTFALPDLRARAIVGADAAMPVGSQSGSNSFLVTSASIPSLNYSGSVAGETLYGGDNDDTINGLAGNDTLNGNGGDDTLNGGDGDDTLNGGNGADTASYATASAAVSVNLNLAGAQNTLGAGSDTLNSIERLTGSAFNDVLTGFTSLDNILDGGAGNDTLNGGTGNDVFVGGAGNDTINGSNGTDTASYADATNGVTVTTFEPSGNPQNTGWGFDNLDSIENLIGSSFNDILSGDGGVNQIRGGAGNDSLYGLGGADNLFGEAGNDIYFVENSGVTVTEQISGGTDEIRTRLTSFTAVLNVEIVSYTGSGNFTGTGAAANDIFKGAGGNDTLFGNAGNDTLYFHGGGDDTGFGGSDNDIFYYGGALTSLDYNDGGSGTDTLVLQGNYATTFGANALIAIEGLSLQSGTITSWGQSGTNAFDYSVTMIDANVGAGQQFRVNGQSLLAGEDLTFNGSAESDGTFLVYGGFGTDLLTGGAGNDIFYFEAGRFGAADRANGGAGRDSVVFSGAPSGSPSPIPLTIFANSLSSIESISFNARFASNPAATPSYSVTLQSGNIAAGANLIVNASSLGATQTFTFNGSAETLGSLTMYGGNGADTLTGGANADTISGMLGADFLRGNGGADIFVFRTVADSKPTSIDRILDFASGSDRIDLSLIDANTLAAGDNAFSFIGSAAFSNVAGQLRATFDSASTTWTILGDVDGNGVADLQILAIGSTTLTAADFLL